MVYQSIRLYQLASQLRYISDWIKNDNEFTWLDLESSQTKYPLYGLLFASEQKKIKTSVDDMIVVFIT